MNNKKNNSNNIKEDFTWVFGRHSVFSVLENPNRKVIKVLYYKKFYDYGNDIKLRILKSDKETLIKPVEKVIIDKIFNENVKHQGIIAKCRKLNFKSVDDVIKLYTNKLNKVGLILDGITDVNNIGSIYRSALAFNVDFIITEKKNTPIENGSLINASCGSFDQVNTYKTININSSIKKLKDHNWWIIGLDQDGDYELNNFLKNKKPEKNLLFILGSEGKGIRRLIKKNCDYLVKININKKSSSINVSNAASILMYNLNCL